MPIAWPQRDVVANGEGFCRVYDADGHAGLLLVGWGGRFTGVP